MKVLLERYPYKYCEAENGEQGWIEKFNPETKRYYKMYECDSRMQFFTAMEDYEYTKWLDPAGVNCYVKDRVGPGVDRIKAI